MLMHSSSVYNIYTHIDVDVVYIFHKYRFIESAVVIFSRQLGKTKIKLMVFLASTDYLQSPDRKKEYELLVCSSQYILTILMPNGDIKLCKLWSAYSWFLAPRPSERLQYPKITSFPNFLNTLYFLKVISGYKSTLIIKSDVQ